MIDFKQYLQHLGLLFCYATQLRNAGLTMANEPHDVRRAQSVDMYTDLIGDPEKNPRGIPYHSVKVTNIYDQTLEILATKKASATTVSGGSISCGPLLHMISTKQENGSESYNIQVKHEDLTDYKPVLTLAGEAIPDDGPIYYLPVQRYTKTQQPYLITLNWDKALVQPGDLGPMFKYFPLARQGSYLGMSLFVLMHKIVDMMASEELLYFIAQTDASYGAYTIMQFIEKYFGKQTLAILEPSFNYIQNLIHFSSLIRWVHQSLKRQTLANTSYESIIRYLADKPRDKQIEEAIHAKEALDRVKALSSAHPVVMKDMISDITYTNFGVSNGLGTTTTVTTRSLAMTSEGSYCTSAFQSKPEFTQSLVKHLSVFKQTVDSSLMTGNSSGEPNFVQCFDKYHDIAGNQQKRKVRIPTSNWNDIMKFRKCLMIKQISQTSNNNSTDLATVLSQLEDVFYLNNTKTASAKWSATSGQFTLSTTSIEGG